MSRAFIKCKVPVLTTTQEAVLIIDGYKHQAWVPLSVLSEESIEQLVTNLVSRGNPMNLEIQEWKAKRLNLL